MDNPQLSRRSFLVAAAVPAALPSNLPLVHDLPQPPATSKSFVRIPVAGGEWLWYPDSPPRPTPYEVWLIDPSGESSDELVYRAVTRHEAGIFVAEWEKDDCGLTAVIRHNDASSLGPEGGAS